MWEVYEWDFLRQVTSACSVRDDKLGHGKERQASRRQGAEFITGQAEGVRSSRRHASTFTEPFFDLLISLYHRGNMFKLNQ